MKVAPATFVAVRLNVGVPSHTFPLFPAVTVQPPHEFTVIVAVAAVDDGHIGFPPDELTVYVYVPGVEGGVAVTVAPVVPLKFGEAFQL